MSRELNAEFLASGLDCQALLQALGAERITVRGVEIFSLCPLHEEKTPSFSLNLEKGLFHCFACGAEGNVISLIQKKLRLSFEDACQWLMNFCGLQGQAGAFVNLFIKFKESNAFIDSIKRVVELFQDQNTIFDESFLNKLTHEHREFYLEKGFSEAILDEFEVGYAVDPQFVGRLFFPLRNEQGGLIGFTGRRIDGKDKVMKWIHSFALAKKNMLYNLHRAKSHAIIENTKELILTEGPGDCMRAAQYGKRNVVGLLGSSLAEFQKWLLLKHAFRLVLALDGDVAGQQATKRIIYDLWGDFELYTLSFPAEKDLADLSRQEFETTYEQKIRITSRSSQDLIGGTIFSGT